MKSENQQSGNGGKIILSNDSEEVGFLIYTISPEVKLLTISYVMVHRKFEGRGMGKFLVEEAIKFARENQWKVLPHCSYSRSVMLRMSDIEDVFPK